jgi:serine/threonine protein kinase
MGVVYRARDPLINRLVALKTITASGADYQSLLQRFYREAQSAGGLQHPNIVTIYELGDEAGVAFIAMELIEGENLEQLISRRTPIPIPLKLVYAMQACSAFDYAHKRGIVHRDIKPGNMMVNKDGAVKVVDFGIARVLETSKTQTGMLIGTFAYMSPEQYHGEHADERSDIWSFGVLLYELLCYQRPFSGATPAALMHSICSQEAPPLRSLDATLPAELEPVMSRLLQKAPEDRYQSMEDLLLELDPIYKSLQAESVGGMVAQSRELADHGDYSRARDLLRQALQIDSKNATARTLLEKVNAELRRVTIRPKAQKEVEKGKALLEQGKIQEAKAAAEDALHMDSSFEPAQELQRLVARWRETAACRGHAGGSRSAARKGSRGRAGQQTSESTSGAGSQRKSGATATSAVDRKNAGSPQSVESAEIRRMRPAPD